MPLVPGNSRAAISENISELTHHGSRPRSHAQIVAIALSNADRTGHAFGGGIGSIGHGGGGLGHIGIGAPSSRVMSASEGSPWWERSEARQMTAPAHGIGHFAVGGMMSASEASPWWERSDSRAINDIPHGGGLIGGSGAGRTDQIPLVVGADSHVMPADVVSGLGQGHTLAGARILDAALKTGPWGTALPHEVRGHGPPAPPHLSTAADNPAPTGIARTMETGLASGGAPHRKTSILAASGEYIVEPEVVEALGQRILNQGGGKRGQSVMSAGHEALDELIGRVRKFNIAWLRSAPPPKK